VKIYSYYHWIKYSYTKFFEVTSLKFGREARIRHIFVLLLQFYPPVHSQIFEAREVAFNDSVVITAVVLVYVRSKSQIYKLVIKAKTPS
jgi:hypothetical protein